MRAHRVFGLHPCHHALVEPRRAVRTCPLDDAGVRGLVVRARYRHGPGQAELVCRHPHALDVGERSRVGQNAYVRSQAFQGDGADCALGLVRTDRVGRVVHRDPGARHVFLLDRLLIPRLETAACLIYKDFVRIIFKKKSNERHILEVIRKDHSHESVELETKSLWLHDFVHFAVEAEAGLQNGFWGLLAAGKTMSEMNDRTGKGIEEYADTMALIEMLVGALSGAMSGTPSDDVATDARRYLESSGRSEDVPAWLTSDFVVRARERLRKLIGHWNGTPFGEEMELLWNE